ncbi:MAG: RNA methyltransferase [Capnocytophaga sp.]|nr:RNA methyltransferase [Capnocytophaga sp.]
MKEISSVHNPSVKHWVALQEKSRTRKQEQLFLIEGIREIRLACQGGYELASLLWCADITSEITWQQFGVAPSKVIAISKEVYKKIAYRNSTEGIIAIGKCRNHSLDAIVLSSENPLVLVAEAPEKPGNIGALLRTADAAGVDAVLIANPRTDVYNPNIIRSSVGCVFTNTIGVGTTNEIIRFLQDRNIQIRCAALSASVPYDEVDYTHGTAIVVGTEDEGLTEEWLKHSAQNIIIPMEGVIDSMNVSVAASVLIYEAKRQRKNHQR